MKTDYFDKAAQQFANLMIEKIQQVEDNWQKPGSPLRRIHAISFRRTSQDAGTPEATPFYSFSFARNSSTRHPYL